MKNLESNMLHVKNNSNRVSNIQFLLIVCFYSFFFLFADLGRGLTVCALVVFIVFAIFFVLKSHVLKEPEVKTYRVGLFLVVATILLNIRSIDYFQSNIFYLYGMFLVVYALLFIKPNVAAKKVALNILLFVAGISAFIVFLSRLFPAFYVRYIASHFAIEAYNGIILLLREGYSGALGGNISLTANYIALGIAICFGRFLQTKKKKHAVVMVVLFIALLLVNRRSELLAAVAAWICMLFLMGSKRLKIIILFGCVIAFIGLLIVVLFVRQGIWHYQGSNRLIASVYGLLQGQDITNGRSELYALAWSLFCEHPLFGIGWGQYRFYAQAILPQITNVHNIYLQLLCETGIVGGFILLSALFYLLKELYKKNKIAIKNGTMEYTVFSLFSWLYIMILGIFDNPIFQDQFWLLLGVILFCAVNEKSKRKTV